MDARSAEIEMMENMLPIGCCVGRRGNIDLIMCKDFCKNVAVQKRKCLLKQVFNESGDTE